MFDKALADKTINYVQASSILMKKAMAELAPLKQDAEKAAAERSDLLSSLVEAGAVPASSIKQAEELISTHTGTSQLLKQAVAKIKEIVDEQSRHDRLGQSVDPSLAGSTTQKVAYDSLSDPYAGRKTSEKKASDIAYEKALLG